MAKSGGCDRLSLRVRACGVADVAGGPVDDVNFLPIPLGARRTDSEDLPRRFRRELICGVAVHLSFPNSQRGMCSSVSIEDTHIYCMASQKEWRARELNAIVTSVGQLNPLIEQFENYVFMGEYVMAFVDAAHLDQLNCPLGRHEDQGRYSEWACWREGGGGRPE